jgi:predicted nucleic acid-binding protein
LITAIDSTVIIDVILADVHFAKTSANALAAALELGPLIVSETVVAEIFPVFEISSELDEFFERTGIHLEPSTMGTLSRAGAAWDRYRERQKWRFVCQACGRIQSISCVACGARIEGRQHLISDFLIGAHAAEQADQLLTRDRGYFRTYFPDLKLI